MAFDVILAKPFNVGSLDNVEESLDIAAKRTRVDFRLWANAFENTLPTFEIHKAPEERLIIPKRNRDGQIVSFVISGTSVRFATMTDPFEAKTKPGSLVTGPGTGDLAYVDTSKPRPGIVSRDTHQILADKHGKVLENAILKAIKEM